MVQSSAAGIRISTSSLVRCEIAGSVRREADSLRLLDMLSGGGSLANYLNDDEDFDDGEDTRGEEDLKDDPIYALDLQVRPHSPFLPT